MMIRVRRQATLSAFVAIMLAACGGGGGGGGGGGADPLTSSPPVLGSTPGSETTTSSDGSSRTINADCAVTQNLAGARGDNLRIDSVRWLQSVEMPSDDPETRLAGGKAVKLRIDLLASGSPVSPSSRTLRVYDPATGDCTNIAVTGPARVPASRDPESLSTAYTATIPASLVKPGMTAILAFDDSNGRSAAEADATFRVLAPDVAPAVKEVLRIIPLSLLGNLGYVPPDTSRIADLLVRLYPVSQVDVRVEAPMDITTLLLGSLISKGGKLLGSLDLMQNLLDTVDDRCAALNGRQSDPRTAPKCLALIPDNLLFSVSADSGGQYTGLAFVGGITMLTRSVSQVDITGITSPYDYSHWLDYNAMTVAHEYGHLLDLDHANCGGASGLDPRLYSDGRLGGVAGYDAGRNVYFSTSRRNSSGDPMFADVMSYCGKEWVSDRGYLAALAYRSGSAARVSARAGAGSVSVETHQWLKISLAGKDWRMRRAGFAPSTLTASDLRLEVTSDQGVETLPLLAAVMSEHHRGRNFGPFYADLGGRQVMGLRLFSGGVEVARWQASDL